MGIKEEFGLLDEKEKNKMLLELFGMTGKGAKGALQVNAEMQSLNYKVNVEPIGKLKEGK